ncbi:hypothetical protein [uncultured Treponema sp.]|uniref:hypothetical protein n=1 Tax=uncultured Treponema sp. TaxID=162155 RepID=UPI002606B293|nr:hypothetical protein [uncultured Treponema sp.]
MSYYYDDSVLKKIICFFVFLILFALLLFVYGLNLGEKKSESKSIECTVNYVSLVKYSNSSTLCRYVYLSMPKGKEIEIEDNALYDVAKNHIGQKIKIEINQIYFLRNDGKKHIVRNHLIRPVKVLGVEGETQEYEERIQYVERKREVPIYYFLP